MVSLCNVCRMSGFHRHLFTGRTAPSLPITCTLSLSLSLSLTLVSPLSFCDSLYLHFTFPRSPSFIRALFGKRCRGAFQKQKKEEERREKKKKETREEGKTTRPGQTVLLVSFRESRITFHKLRSTSAHCRTFHFLILNVKLNTNFPRSFFQLSAPFRSCLNVEIYRGVEGGAECCFQCRGCVHAREK